MNLNNNLPVLPLRDIVVFPGMVIPLFVGRDKSITALDEVMKKDKKMIHSICFSSMRNIQVINIVIKKLVKKVNNNDIGFFLLISRTVG